MDHSPNSKTLRLVQDTPPADEAVYHPLVDCHIAFASLERAARLSRSKNVELDEQGFDASGIARLE